MPRQITVSGGATQVPWCGVDAGDPDFPGTSRRAAGPVRRVGLREGWSEEVPGTCEISFPQGGVEAGEHTRLLPKVTG
jgi:hypothetical protein